MRFEREYEVHTEESTRTLRVFAEVRGEYVRATFETPGEGPEVEIVGARWTDTKEKIGYRALLKILADAEGIEVSAMESRLEEEFAEEAAEYDPRDDDEAFDRMRDGD